MEKNFDEMLNQLPTRQRQQFIDHMVGTLLGKPTQLINLKTITISDDTPLDEQIRLTAEAFGINPNKIDRVQYEGNWKKVSDSKKYIKELIDEHLDWNEQPANRKKNDELISLGKFLYTIQQKPKIIPGESPDFKLQYSDKTIGLEHTRLEIEADNAFTNELWKQYLNGAIKILFDENSSLTGVINLILDVDKPVFNNNSLKDFKDLRGRRSEVHKQIADYLRSVIIDEEGKPPPYISSATYQRSNDSFTIKLNEDYWVRLDFEERLLKVIEKKEQLLEKYKRESNLASCWLLIVYSDSASSSFRVEETRLTSLITTLFDRILLLNSLNLACYEVEKDSYDLKNIAQKQLPTSLVLTKE